MTVYSIFGQSGSGVIANDPSGYTMGMEFSLSSPAPLTGIWFYSASGATVLPGGCCIYQVTGQTQVSGTVNTSPTWSGAIGSGWVKCSYPGTTTLASGTNYKVCVFYIGGASGEWYSVTANYWSSGPGSGGLTSGPITAVNNAGGDGGQDTFVTPSGALTYPTTSFNASNYWVDVEVTTSSPPPSVPTVLYSMRSFP